MDSITVLSLTNGTRSLNTNQLISTTSLSILSTSITRGNTTSNPTDSIKTIIPEQYQAILLSFAYGIISLLAMLGNASIIYIVLRNRRMHSVTNYFICNLSLSDCLVACFAIPFQVHYNSFLISRDSLSFPVI